MNLVIRAVLVLAACAAIATGVPAARVRLIAADRPAVRGPVAHRQSHAVLPDSIVILAERAAPFRMRRSATSVAYDPTKVGVNALPQPPRAPRPALTLSGIVWGAAPSIVLEGIPGTDGPRVLSRGDTLGGLRIRQIRRSDVVVTGLDTTWVLRVREVW